MTKWLTRERPKIDRVACPWLIRRFVEPDAEFLYVPTERVFAVAEETGANSLRHPGRRALRPRRRAVLLRRLHKAPRPPGSGPQRLALVVHGADTARHDLAPETSGLHAISLGLSANIPDDHTMLEQGMVVYDALYAWCRGAAGEVHNWTSAKASSAAAPEGKP